MFRTTQLLMFLALPPLLQLSLGGFVASSGIALWSMVTPLAALAFLGIRRAIPDAGGLLHGLVGVVVQQDGGTLALGQRRHGGEDGVSANPVS